VPSEVDTGRHTATVSRQQAGRRDVAAPRLGKTNKIIHFRSFSEHENSACRVKRLA